jgi:hypothetical protein
MIGEQTMRLRTLFTLLTTLTAIPVSAAITPASCRALLAVELEAGGDNDAYFRAAAAAHRDCRGEGLPLEIRLGATTRHADVQALRGELQAAMRTYGEAVALLDAARVEHAASVGLAGARPPRPRPPDREIRG